MFFFIKKSKVFFFERVLDIVNTHALPTMVVLYISSTAHLRSRYQPPSSSLMPLPTGIMTNAHVVADQSLVMVRKHGSAVKYIAEVEHVGHDCDLAILNVEDESFWEGKCAPCPLHDVFHMRARLCLCLYLCQCLSLSSSLALSISLYASTFALDG